MQYAEPLTDNTAGAGESFRRRRGKSVAPKQPGLCWNKSAAGDVDNVLTQVRLLHRTKLVDICQDLSTWASNAVGQKAQSAASRQASLKSSLITVTWSSPWLHATAPLRFPSQSNPPMQLIYQGPFLVNVGWLSATGSMHLGLG